MSRLEVQDAGPLCIGLPPVVAARPHTLILGSMPGVRSLELQQYYGHTQNAFWKIMGVIFNAPNETYDERLALVRGNRLALWDTLKCCIRPGSLDSEISDDSIEVNDFRSFLEQHNRILRVFFNGSKSASEFKKRVMPDLPQELIARLSFTRLPSTSPANASQSFEKKLAAWRIVARPAGS